MTLKTSSPLIPLFLLAVMKVHPVLAQAPVEVSPPQGTTVSIYDTGLAIVNESRRVSVPAGESVLVVRDLPVEVDASSISLGAGARSLSFDLLAQEMRFDFGGVGEVLQRLVGQPVVCQLVGQAKEGVLLSGLMRSPDTSAAEKLAVRSRDGKDLWMIGLEDLSSMTFPFSREMLATVPESVWRIRSRQDGPQNFRLSYRTGGLEWKASYDLLLENNSQQGDLIARVGLMNGSGGRFENARVRLLQTEKGLSVPAMPREDGSALARSPLVYGYGSARAELEQIEAGVAPIHIYELPRTITLESGRQHFVSMVQSAELPLKRFYVYDGVRFDRFQRNPRTDWNYGTEYREVVQKHIEFANEEKFGLGVDLPPGLCRVLQVRADGVVDLIGETYLPHIGKGGAGAIRVGPAIGLRGERERTGYLEVKPHREYEESFEIRLQNSSDEPAEIRVVEHLYRGTDYEIVRTDADFSKVGPQTMEFRIELKPGARRSIHYTVRYLW